MAPQSLVVKHCSFCSCNLALKCYQDNGARRLQRSSSPTGSGISQKVFTQRRLKRQRLGPRQLSSPVRPVQIGSKRFRNELICLLLVWLVAKGFTLPAAEGDSVLDNRNNNNELDSGRSGREWPQTIDTKAARKGPNPNIGSQAIIVSTNLALKSKPIQRPNPSRSAVAGGLKLFADDNDDGELGRQRRLSNKSRSKPNGAGTSSFVQFESMTKLASATSGGGRRAYLADGGANLICAAARNKPDGRSVVYRPRNSAEQSQRRRRRGEIAANLFQLVPIDEQPDCSLLEFCPSGQSPNATSTTSDHSAHPSLDWIIKVVALVRLGDDYFAHRWRQQRSILNIPSTQLGCGQAAAHPLKCAAIARRHSRRGPSPSVRSTRRAALVAVAVWLCKRFDATSNSLVVVLLLLRNSTGLLSSLEPELRLGQQLARPALNQTTSNELLEAVAVKRKRQFDARNPSRTSTSGRRHSPTGPLAEQSSTSSWSQQQTSRSNGKLGQSLGGANLVVGTFEQFRRSKRAQPSVELATRSELVPEEAPAKFKEIAQRNKDSKRVLAHSLDLDRKTPTEKWLNYGVRNHQDPLVRRPEAAPAFGLLEDEQMNEQLVDLLAEFYAHLKSVQEKLAQAKKRYQQLASVKVADKLPSKNQEEQKQKQQLQAIKMHLGADEDSLLKWLGQRQGRFNSLQNISFELVPERPNHTINVCPDGPKIYVLPNVSDIVYCYTREQWIEKLWSDLRLSAFHYPIILLNILIFLVGTTGNIFVCLSVKRNHQLRSVTNYFIVNLAFADFLVILICLPATVVWDLSLTWFFDTIPCKLIMFLQDVSISVSVLTLTAISIDRYYAICHPLKFKTSLNQAKHMIVLIWLVSLAIMTPDLFYLSAKKSADLTEAGLDTVLYSDCNYDWSDDASRAFQFVKTVLLYLLPFLLMFCAHYRILKVLRFASSIISSDGMSCGGGGGVEMLGGTVAATAPPVTSVLVAAGQPHLEALGECVAAGSTLDKCELNTGNTIANNCNNHTPVQFSVASQQQNSYSMSMNGVGEELDELNAADHTDRGDGSTPSRVVLLRGVKMAPDDREADPQVGVLATETFESCCQTGGKQEQRRHHYRHHHHHHHHHHHRHHHSRCRHRHRNHCCNHHQNNNNLNNDCTNQNEPNQRQFSKRSDLKLVGELLKPSQPTVQQLLRKCRLKCKRHDRLTKQTANANRQSVSSSSTSSSFFSSSSPNPVSVTRMPSDSRNNNNNQDNLNQTGAANCETAFRQSHQSNKLLASGSSQVEAARRPTDERQQQAAAAVANSSRQVRFSDQRQQQQQPQDDALRRPPIKTKARPNSQQHVSFPAAFKLAILNSASGVSWRKGTPTSAADGANLDKDYLKKQKLIRGLLMERESSFDGLDQPQSRQTLGGKADEREQRQQSTRQVNFAVASRLKRRDNEPSEVAEPHNRPPVESLTALSERTVEAAKSSSVMAASQGDAIATCLTSEYSKGVGAPARGVNVINERNSGSIGGKRWRPTPRQLARSKSMGTANNHCDTDTNQVNGTQKAPVGQLMPQTPMATNQQPQPPHAIILTMHNKSKLESRRKAAKMLTAIVVLFGICYLPVHLINFLRQFIDNIPQTDVTSTISMLSHCVCYLNSAINPIIYNHMNSVFRAEFRKFLSCLDWRRQQHKKKQKQISKQQMITRRD